MNRLTAAISRTILCAVCFWALVPACSHAGQTAVLVLGYSCQSGNWQDVTWGTAPDKPGRLVRAAAEALGSGAGMMLFSGGTTGCNGGQSEAHAMSAYLLEHADELSSFTTYPALKDITGDQARAALAGIMVMEDKARNTMENFKFTCDILANAGVEKVILVTSPDHMARAKATAKFFWAGKCKKLAENIQPAPSATSYK